MAVHLPQRPGPRDYLRGNRYGTDNRGVTRPENLGGDSRSRGDDLPREVHRSDGDPGAGHLRGVLRAAGPVVRGQGLPLADRSVSVPLRRDRPAQLRDGTGTAGGGAARYLPDYRRQGPLVQAEGRGTAANRPGRNRHGLRQSLANRRRELHPRRGCRPRPRAHRRRGDYTTVGDELRGRLQRERPPGTGQHRARCAGADRPHGLLGTGAEKLRRCARLRRGRRRRDILPLR